MTVSILPAMGCQTPEVSYRFCIYLVLFISYYVLSLFSLSYGLIHLHLVLSHVVLSWAYSLDCCNFSMVFVHCILTAVVCFVMSFYFISPEMSHLLQGQQYLCMTSFNEVTIYTISLDPPSSSCILSAPCFLCIAFLL